MEDWKKGMKDISICIYEFGDAMIEDHFTRKEAIDILQQYIDRLEED